LAQPNALQVARKTRAAFKPVLLNADDLAAVAAVALTAQQHEDALTNNPQNARHANKACCILNKGSDFFRQGAPRVLAKMAGFAIATAEAEGWSSLLGVGPARALRVRTVEHWTYAVGGGLVDDAHYDGG
jgi:hypothetical protein